MLSLFGIPSSLISSAFGALTGFMFKARAQNMEIQAAERKHNMDMLVAVAKANRNAIKDEAMLLEAKAKYEERLTKIDPHRSFARRVLAFGLMIGVVFGVPAMVFFGDTQWFHLHEHVQKSNGFFGLGAYTREVVDVVVAHGLPLTWLTALLDVFAGIIAFYFGGSLAKFRNPYTQ